jgi:hypothetical protein
MTKLYTAAGGALAVCILGLAVYAVSIFGRPPMPVPLGTVLWDDETGFTVSRVAHHPVSAGTSAYEVTVRMYCPFGERYGWTLHSAHVFDNSGRTYYASSGSAAHRILGATDTEHLTFLLPANVEQPALVFDDTLRLSSIAGALRAGPPELYEPHRFNLRYD